MSWQNRPLLAASSTFQEALSRSDFGGPNSMPIIRPLPRTSFSNSYPGTMRVSARRSSAPRLAADSISFSDSMTSSVAMPAAIARSFLEKVEPCTTARSIWLKILSKMLLRVSTAPTGTWPPDSEEAAGAAHAGLDLVGDEQRAVFLTERSRTRQELVGGHVDALALDRLDDEGRDLARGQRFFQRGKIVEWDRGAARQQRLEAGTEVRIARQRQRAIGQAMIAVGAIDDARAAGGAARELDCRLDAFSAGIGKEHLVEIGNVFQKPLGEHAGQHRDVELDQIGQLGIEHAFQRLAHHRMIAPDRKHTKTGQKVEIARIVAIVEVLPLPFLEADIVADGLENPDELLVQVPIMQGAALGLTVRE